MIKKMSCCAKNILILIFLQIKRKVKYKLLKTKMKRNFKISYMKMKKSITKRLRDLKVTTQYFCKLRTYNNILKIHILTFSPNIRTQIFKLKISSKDKISLKIINQTFSIFYHYFLGKTIFSKSYKKTSKTRIQKMKKKTKN